MKQESLESLAAFHGVMSAKQAAVGDETVILVFLVIYT